MFVLLGYNLLRNVIGRRDYCAEGTNCNKFNYLLDTNFGGSSLGIWLEWFQDPLVYQATQIKVEVIPMNQYFLHKKHPKYEKFMVADNFYPYEVKEHNSLTAENFCQNYLLWHKASSNDQLFLFEKNRGQFL